MSVHVWRPMEAQAYNLGKVDVVQGCINFVQDEERCRLKAVDGKKKRKSSNCFLPPRQLVHVAEPLHRGHGVVFDTTEIRLLAVLEAEVCGATKWLPGASCQILVDTINL